MSERWIELPVVVEVRWALAQALRQWKSYADEIAACEHKHYLGDGNELEDKFYARAKAALDGLEAAADESAKASLAPKPAFAPAHGSASLTWTVEQPRASGMWWWWSLDPEREPEMVEVRYDQTLRWMGLGPTMHWPGLTRVRNVMMVGGVWAGPVNPPETPSADTTAND